MTLSVVGAPVEEVLTTVRAVKDRAGIPAADASKDGLIGQLIREASGDIVRHCRRPFRRSRVRETGLGFTGRDLLLSLTPIVEVHSVTIDGETILSFEVEDADAGIVSGSGSSMIGSGEALWWNDGFRPRGGQRVSAEYTGGFVPPSDEAGAPARTLPYDLEAACVELVFEKLPSAPSAPRVKSKSVGDLSISYDLSGGGGGAPSITALDRLERWRRVV